MALILPSNTRAFTFNALNVPSKQLNRFVVEEDTAIKKPTDLGTLLDVKLEVGKDQRHRMTMSGLCVELLPNNIAKNAQKNFPGLPGAQGPNPKSSTGAKHLNIKKKPCFIDMTGTQAVRLEQGAWEVVWRDNSPSGSLVVGFNVPDTYQRNDATLPKGKLYMSFPVWTTETLAKAQELKSDAQARGKELLDEKAEAMRKYEADGNILKKAMFYKEALSAAERFSLVPLYKDVPADKDTMILQDDLIINTQGSVWSKKEGGGGFFQNSPDKTFLGMATLSPALMDDKEFNGDTGTTGQLRP